MSKAAFWRNEELTSSKHGIFLWLLIGAALVQVLYRSSIPLQELGSLSWIEVGVRTVLACAAVFHLSFHRNCSTAYFCGLLITLALLLHFPGNLTFHWDEWEVLWRYADNGVTSSLTAHGAHVMPVFMLYFLAQVELLQFSYPLLLLVSSILVGINGLVVEQFLLSLGTGELFDRRAIRVLACLFVISSLQLEVSQWAFIQCVTLQNIATIYAASQICRWQQSSARKDLIPGLFALGLAPLLQGTGVITVGVCILAMWISTALRWTANPTIGFQLKQTITKSLQFAIWAALASIPAVILYLIYGTSPEAPDLSWSMFQHADVMLAFFLNGTLGVTVMRGLGLFPSLSMDAPLAAQYWANLPSALQGIVGKPEQTIVFLGMVILLIIGVLSISEKRRWRANLILFVSGMLIISVFFVLPTLGRWQYGVSASIFSRYQTRHLLGLALLMLPLLSRLLFETKSSVICLAAWALLFAHIGLQTSMEASSTHFIDYGQRTELLICRAQNHPQQRIRDEIETTILPHWAFTGDVFRHVLKTHGLRCNISSDDKVYAASPT